ncbi:MAG: RtcB family protein [candidate division WOR-3 bacterium]
MEKVFKKVDDYRWMIQVDYKKGMKVPGIVYAKESMLKEIVDDGAHEQVANAAFLPGIVKASLAMPDIHFGYGLPIGGVIATDMEEDGVVTPGGVGFDINCGVRLLRSNLSLKDVEDKLEELIDEIFENVPSGVGSTSGLKLSKNDAKGVWRKGAKWAVEMGYGDKEDLDATESSGCLEFADPDLISERAYDRGRDQLGTLGSGNHFLEIQVVEEVFNERLAEKFGLFKGQITIMIHTGSRGFGHQVCTDFLKVMEGALKKYDIYVPDRQLACAPYKSKEGQDYLGAMACAANFAWANRQIITDFVRKSFEKVYKTGWKKLGLSLLYDVAHNIVKIEEHIVDGKKKKLLVHRKGATRAFPKGHPELPETYRETGQPVIIPGDMGRASYVLCGTEKAMEETFGSTCHGAGRLMSRHQAEKVAKGKDIVKEMEKRGVIVRAASKRTLYEEIPEAYKDVSEVVEVVYKAGIAQLVAKMKPLAVVKG